MTTRGQACQRLADASVSVRDVILSCAALRRAVPVQRRVVRFVAAEAHPTAARRRGNEGRSNSASSAVKISD
jgi:hypothetical protein